MCHCCRIILAMYACVAWAALPALMLSGAQGVSLTMGAAQTAFKKRTNMVTEVRLQQLTFDASEPVLKDGGISHQSIIWDSTKTMAVLTLTLLSTSVDAVGLTTPLDNEQRFLSVYYDFCMSQQMDQLVVAADHALSGDVIHHNEDMSRRLPALARQGRATGKFQPRQRAIRRQRAGYRYFCHQVLLLRRHGAHCERLREARAAGRRKW